MKKNILLFILILLTYDLIAQITVTNSTFPESGDTLRIARDMDPDINLQNPGEDITWNFTSLDGPVFESIIEDASQGSAFADFSNATILTGEIGIAETYFQATSSEYTSLGFSGQDPLGFGLDVIFKNTPPLIERMSPLNFEDDYNSNSSTFVPFAWDELPATITDSLALPISPDSIAIGVETSRTEIVDAWGKVFLPVGYFDVLRVRRWDVTETKVEAYLPFIQWTDVTDIIGGGLGGDTTLTYRYYNDVSKEPIAVITVDPITEEPTSAQFKSVDPSTGIIKLHKKQPSIYAYPNPAIDKVRFDVVNVPSGKYDLNIYNILGIKVWSQQYEFGNTSDTVQLNVSDFNKGTYLYSLVNDRGKTIMTKRLVVMRP